VIARDALRQRVRDAAVAVVQLGERGVVTVCEEVAEEGV
jgi:hypothetical protein